LRSSMRFLVSRTLPLRVTSHRVRRNLDFLVMLNLLHLFVLSVPPPFVKLLDDEHRSHHTGDDQQNIHRRILSNVRKMNIYIHVAVGSVRPNTAVELTNLSLAHFLIMRHSITSHVHRLHITSIGTSSLIPDASESRSNFLLQFLVFVMRFMTRFLGNLLHDHFIRLNSTFVRFRFGIVIHSVRPHASIVLSNVTFTFLLFMAEFGTSLLHHLGIAIIMASRTIPYASLFVRGSRSRPR